MTVGYNQHLSKTSKSKTKYPNLHEGSFYYSPVVLDCASFPLNWRLRISVNVFVYSHTAGRGEDQTAGSANTLPPR